MIGVRRAAFSNEAGVGSAPIAHSAARVEYPVQEGLVSLLEPFIDTVIVCTMSGIVVVVTGAWALPEFQEANALGRLNGAAVTSTAWRSAGGWFPYLLALATMLFAFSTLISWSYYGERCWAFLFGPRSAIVYKLIFVGFVFVGSTIKLGNVIDFSDAMLFGMAFPNLIGCILLSGKVRADVRDYWGKLKRGELRKYP
jgi:AGCS family alanine or glycine:cation symporter